MAEENTQITQAPVAPEEHKVRNVNAEYVNRSPATPQQPALRIPEKFKGDTEAFVKAYEEAERKITEYGTKYKNYDEYAAISPDPAQIKEALDWARNVKTAMDRGLLVEAAKAEATRKQENAPSASAPWDTEGWEYKPDSEKSRAMYEYSQAQTKTYIDGLAKQYGDQIDGLRKMDGREKSILMKTIKAAIKNPGVDPEELLSRAAEFMNKSPEDLLDLVLENQNNSPASREKEINRVVEERLAEKRQDWEKERFNDFTVSKRPKFTSRNMDRATEDRDILQKLAKDGFRW